MKTPNPIASSFGRNSGWVIASSRSAERQHRAGDERSEDHLEAELTAATAANPTNSTIAPRTRIWAVVSWSRSRSARDPPRPLGPAHDEEDHARQREQAADQDQRRAGAALAGEEDREQDDRAEVGDRPGSDHELAEGGRDLTRVLEHRDDHPERRRREDHRDEQRGLDQAARLQRQARDDREPRTRARSRRPASRSSRPRSLSNSTSSPARKSRKTSPIVGDDRDRLVDLDPPEARPARSTIPAMISSTTAGSRTLGKKPSRKGAAKATATTSSRPENAGSACPSVGRGREALRRA